jgi:hypothetical protein
MWDKISVWQYQQMYPIITNPSKDWTEKDIEHKLIAIINSLTENEVNKLPKKELDKYRSELYFLKDNYEGVPVDRIIANKRRYRFIKDAKDINTARYIESKFFMKDLIPNLHKVAASVVIPQERKWFKYVDLKYDSDLHQEYANDILYANFKEVYFSVVFFYQVFNDWMPITKDYLMESMNKQGLTVEKAEKVAAILWSFLGGNTAQK